MAQIAKIEAKAEIKCPPAKVYDFFKYNFNKFTNMFPQVFKSIQLLDGAEGQAGCVRVFEYFLGKTMSVTVKTETINDEERSISYTALGGDIMQMYTSFASKVTIVEGYVEWCIEFEKAYDSAPNPDRYAQLAVEITKGLDAYLLSN